MRSRGFRLALAAVAVPLAVAYYGVALLIVRAPDSPDDHGPILVGCLAIVTAAVLAISTLLLWRRP